MRTLMREEEGVFHYVLQSDVYEAYFMRSLTMLDLRGRPLRRDRQGLIHIGYSWSDEWWEPACEPWQVFAPRNTDEPEGTIPTCLLCLDVAWSKTPNPFNSP